MCGITKDYHVFLTLFLFVIFLGLKVLLPGDSENQQVHADSCGSFSSGVSDRGC